MIGELELELAIAEAAPTATIGDEMSYLSAGVDIGPVLSYARRFHQVKDAAAASREEAVVGAFLLAFRLGVLAARHEPRMEL